MAKLQRNSSSVHLRSTIGYEIHVQDVMTTDVIAVEKFESVMHVAEILAERNISGLPVVDKKKKVIGIITQADIISVVGMTRDHSIKDILKYMLGEPLPERKSGDIVGDIMATNPLTIRPDASIADAARIMNERKIRRLPVVDEKNILIGIISRADILKAVIKNLK